MINIDKYQVWYQPQGRQTARSNTTKPVFFFLSIIKTIPVIISVMRMLGLTKSLTLSSLLPQQNVWVCLCFKAADQKVHNMEV